MSLPWSVDALRPANERYASLKFRRFARKFRIYNHLAYDDAAELVAFLHIVPFKWARWIFGWDMWMEKRINVLMDHIDEPEMVRQNIEACDVDVGVAVLEAMRDGGWTKGSVPEVVWRAMLDLLGQGWSQPEVARRFGVPRSHVQHHVARQSRRGKVAERAVALGKLQVG